MVDEVLSLLKSVVNEFLSASTGWGASQGEHGQVTFLDSEKVEHLDFKQGAVTLLLVNLEEDFSQRRGDPHRVTLADGSTQRVQPPIHLNLHVLFVARFKDYQQSLRYIALILQFFQSHRVLDHANTPLLSERVEKLMVELMTLSFAELNNLWGVIRNSYQPSLLYKIRMVVFQDEDGQLTPASTAPALRLHP